MQQTPLPSDSIPVIVPAAREDGRFIYIACPWSPAGGGMYKVADYLIQAQDGQPPDQAAQLRPLDTRGPGSALASAGVLMRALGKLVRGRLQGNLAGVHVNMAERLSLGRKGTVVVACRALGIPVVIHLHAQMQRFYRSLPSPLQALTRWMFSLATSVVVIGAEPRRFVIDELGVPVKRVDIVMNGVPGPAHARLQRTDAKVRRVAFVGRLTDIKGVSDLLHALAKVDVDRATVEVVLAGNGDIDKYQALARRLGIDGMVKFAGWFNQDQIDGLLADSDALVLPSHDEVLPLVVLEALAHGLAVICTPVGELPNVLTDGDDALLVPVKDTDALAAALQKVLTQPDCMASLGRNGRALYDRQFSLSRFFTSIARVHQRSFGVAGRLPDVQEVHAAQEAP
jgi:glycosyltransferase involved in cell wall biosynthesis